MEIESINNRIETLISEAEEIRNRPYQKGNFNNLIDLRRKQDLILEECLKAFKIGARFNEVQ